MKKKVIEQIDRQDILLKAIAEAFGFDPKTLFNDLARGETDYPYELINAAIQGLDEIDSDFKLAIATLREALLNLQNNMSPRKK